MTIQAKIEQIVKISECIVYEFTDSRQRVIFTIHLLDGLFKKQLLNEKQYLKLLKIISGKGNLYLNDTFDHKEVLFISLLYKTIKE